MPGGKSPGPSVKNPKAYEALRKQGKSKQDAAAISNAAAKKGGKTSKKGTKPTPKKKAK